MFRFDCRLVEEKKFIWCGEGKRERRRVMSVKAMLECVGGKGSICSQAL